MTEAEVQFSLDGAVAGPPITVIATVRAATVDPDLTDNVRPNTFGGTPAPTTAGPATGAMPATGASSSAIAMMATLVLVAGLTMVGVSRHNRF